MGVPARAPSGRHFNSSATRPQKAGAQPAGFPLCPSRNKTCRLIVSFYDKPNGQDQFLEKDRHVK